MMKNAKWTREDDAVRYEISVPEGVTADVVLSRDGSSGETALKEQLTGVKIIKI